MVSVDWCSNMAIPFAFPSDDDTQANYQRLDQLLSNLFDVLQQILMTQRRIREAQIPQNSPRRKYFQPSHTYTTHCYILSFFVEITVYLDILWYLVLGNCCKVCLVFVQWQWHIGSVSEYLSVQCYISVWIITIVRFHNTSLFIPCAQVWTCCVSILYDKKIISVETSMAHWCNTKIARCQR